MSCPYLMKKEQDLFTFLLYRESCLCQTESSSYRTLLLMNFFLDYLFHLICGN